jgi:hypothetical protein
MQQSACLIWCIPPPALCPAPAGPTVHQVQGLVLSLPALFSPDLGQLQAGRKTRPGGPGVQQTHPAEEERSSRITGLTAVSASVLAQQAACSGSAYARFFFASRLLAGLTLHQMGGSAPVGTGSCHGPARPARCQLCCGALLPG